MPGALIEKKADIFSGAGRISLIMQAMGTRLMHLGKTVHVVGKSTTPSIRAGELLILGSGSGQTPYAVDNCSESSESGCKYLVIYH